MNIIIIEDEPLAAERLATLVTKYDDHLKVVAQLDSVESAIEWFQENEAPDLAFLDIQLADGLSFEIFEHVKVPCPVIFTTAFDQYAVRAFKVNSVDYLLKPLQYESLANALDKYANLHLKPTVQKMNISPDILQKMLGDMNRQKVYKSRFVVRQGEALHTFPTEEVLYVYSEDKSTLLRTRDGKRFVIDFILNELEDMLNPQSFFRVNRGFLVRYDAITEIIPFSQSRLQIRLLHHEEPVLVSKSRASLFKAWLDQ